MRKLTASVLAASVLAGGAFTGAALASPGHSQSSPDRTAHVERSKASSHERKASGDRSRLDKTSRDRTRDSRDR